mmetsp:Transcript_3700/g.4107  ORF Transcript_3700/g.4107 Transcript_3700/m.4107 type:complete len:401 (+) Transcript_3700:1-1203(+)
MTPQNASWAIYAYLGSASEISRWLKLYSDAILHFNVPVNEWNTESIINLFSVLEPDDWITPEAAEILGILAVAAFLAGCHTRAYYLYKKGIQIQALLKDRNTTLHPCYVSAYALTRDYLLMTGNYIEALKFDMGSELIDSLRKDPQHKNDTSLKPLGHLSLIDIRIRSFTINFFVDRAAEVKAIAQLNSTLSFLNYNVTSIPYDLTVITIWCILSKIWLTISVVSPQMLSTNNCIQRDMFNYITEDQYEEFKAGIDKVKLLCDTALHQYNDKLYSIWITTAEFCDTLVLFASRQYNKAVKLAQVVFYNIKESYFLHLRTSIVICMLFDICQVFIQMDKGHLFVEVFNFLFTNFHEQSKPFLGSLVVLADNYRLDYCKADIVNFYFGITSIQDQTCTLDLQ